MLISPIGFMEKPEGFDISRIEVRPFQDQNGREVPIKGPPQSALRFMWPIMFSRKISPFWASRKAGKLVT